MNNLVAFIDGLISKVGQKRLGYDPLAITLNSKQLGILRAEDRVNLWSFLGDHYYRGLYIIAVLNDMPPQLFTLNFNPMDNDDGKHC